MDTTDPNRAPEAFALRWTPDGFVASLPSRPPSPAPFFLLPWLLLGVPVAASSLDLLQPRLQFVVSLVFGMSLLVLGFILVGLGLAFLRELSKPGSAFKPIELTLERDELRVGGRRLPLAQIAAVEVETFGPTLVLRLGAGRPWSLHLHGEVDPTDVHWLADQIRAAIPEARDAASERADAARHAREALRDLRRRESSGHPGQVQRTSSATSASGT